MVNKLIILLYVYSLLAVAGCTVAHTIPLAGRQGDTIFVAVGSPDDKITGENTDLTYTPNGGSAIPIPDSAIISVFNLYPSKTSAAWLYSSAEIIENTTGHGPWTSIMAINLPDDGSLPVGKGSLQVTTTATYVQPVPGPNGANIVLEILPGNGAPSSLDYLGFGQVQLAGDLTQMESMPRLRFAPTFAGPMAYNTYGAVEIKLGIDKRGISEDDFNIIVDDKIGPNKTHNVHTIWNAEKFETTVYFISSTGELNYSDVDFSIISMSLQDQFEAGWQTVATDITVNSTTWYDIDGNVATGPIINVINLTGT